MNRHEEDTAHAESAHDRELSRFFEFSNDMLCIAGFDGYFKRLNSSWEKVTGFSIEELTSQPFLEFVHPDDRQKTLDEVARQQERGLTVVSFENRYVCKDGSYRWIQWMSYPDEERQLLYASARDVTERRQADETLRRLAAIVESSEDAIIGKTLDGVITNWNPAAERLYLYTAEEAIGQSSAILVPPDRGSEWMDILDKIRARDKVEHFESERVRKDGSRVAVALTISPVHDLDGNVTGASTIAQDITERKNAEDALARKALELERSNAELEDFTHVVSHDLKEPLRGIEAFSGFLAEDYSDVLDDQGKNYIDVLQRGAVRMRDLIDDLLQLSSIGRIKPQYTVVPVKAIVDDVTTAMQFSLSNRAAELKVGDLPSIVCDSVRITQVFENLLSNALKYSDKPKPVIEIGYREEPGEHVFFVRDNGPGIDQRHQEKIFRIFQRLVLRDEQEGTGVGLTICKKIAEGHGGRIWLESDGPGSGSTFYFTIADSIEPSLGEEDSNGARVSPGAHIASGGQSGRRGDHPEGAAEGPGNEPAHSGAGRPGSA